MAIPGEDPKPLGCSQAPALSLHQSSSNLFFFGSGMASRGELVHFPELVLQAKEPLA